MKSDAKHLHITNNVIMTDPEKFYRLGNIIAVALKNYVVLFDSSTYPPHAQEFKNYIENCFTLPIKYIFLSHHHSDHSCGLSGLKTKKTQIITHEDFSLNFRGFFNKYISKKDDFEEGLKEWKQQSPDDDQALIKNIQIPKPDITFSEKLTLIDGNSKITFVQTGGHCSDSSIAYFHDEQLLFSGDEVFFYDYPYVSDNSANPEALIKCIQDLLQKKIKILIPAHGKAIIGEENVQFELKRFLKFFHTIKKLIIDNIQLKHTIEEIIKSFQETEQQKLLNLPGIKGICFKGVKEETLEKFFNYYKNLNKIQQEKMKELWDNKEDEVWENV